MVCFLRYGDGDRELQDGSHLSREHFEGRGTDRVAGCLLGERGNFKLSGSAWRRKKLAVVSLLKSSQTARKTPILNLHLPKKGRWKRNRKFKSKWL